MNAKTLHEEERVEQAAAWLMFAHLIRHSCIAEIAALVWEHRSFVVL